MSPATLLLALLLACPQGPLKPGDDTLTLPQGCPAPYAGQLYTMAAHDEVARDFAALDRLIEDIHEQLRDERAAYRSCLEEGADKLQACAEQLHMLSDAVLEEPPPSTSWSKPVIWGGMGALVGGAIAVIIMEANDA